MLCRLLSSASSYSMVCEPLDANVEYKVIDDSKLQHDSTDTDLFPGAEGEMEENDVMGFYFSRLSQRKPAVAEDLHKFQQALLAETSKEEKVMSRFHLQCCSLSFAFEGMLILMYCGR